MTCNLRHPVGLRHPGASRIFEKYHLKESVDYRICRQKNSKVSLLQNVVHVTSCSIDVWEIIETYSCVCVCVYIYTYVYVYNVYIHVYIGVCIYTNIYKYVHIWIYTIHINTCVCIYIYIYVYIYIYIYVYLCMHIVTCWRAAVGKVQYIHTHIVTCWRAAVSKVQVVMYEPRCQHFSKVSSRLNLPHTMTIVLNYANICSKVHVVMRRPHW